jgi:hypothetical protein
MRTPERLSRKDRRRWRPKPILMGILAILIAVAAYLAMKIYWEPEIAPDESAGPTTPTPTEFHARSDLLILRAYATFGLSDTVGPGQMEQGRGGGEAYRAFHQGWPKEMPFLAFVDRLNGLTRAESLGCDCLESPGKGLLDCAIVSGGVIGARIVLAADPNTNFAGRELALVFQNFAGLSADQISSLLKSGMMFSYIADPKMPSNGKARELMSEKGVAAILRLPASRAGWQDFARTISRRKREARVSEIPDKSLIDGAIERHPSTKFIYFDFSHEVDWAVVRAVAERAKAKKLAILLTPGQPGELINIAGQVGIRIYEADFDESFAGKPLSTMKSDLVKALISGGPPKGAIVCPDTSGLTLESLWLFKTYFEKMGVRFRPLAKVIEPLEGSLEPSS